ncbi:hypothetical protein HS088_TW16G00802 [Tripterygium wilfordii]|uniref:Zinc finger matrin-type protein n=1 Tax=Tripterygium wilfordii TaxID=458696 RepID=A0A7J7CJV9_TRIWF|nr:uncharacterized protein LOC119980305 [Tripterygium wilfordii]KAF5734353.1 hypothetical protein HS088_TW16G00802 [Tripterygium wilfordii]
MTTISICINSLSPPPLPRSFSSSLPNVKPLFHRRCKSKTPKQVNRKVNQCRADLSHDAPFAAAIGACVLTTLVLPVSNSPDDDGGSPMDSTDTRFGVMGIISFIPYFNWLSWVFAWLDTGKRRYAIYALVYLAPYLRSNLSLSPEESWLPIFSIVVCIIHIQLEASIRNGDLQSFQLFSDISKHLQKPTIKKDFQSNRHQGISEETKRRRVENKNLPSAEEKHSRDIHEWGVHRKPFEHREHLNGDWDEDGRED